MCPLRPRLAPSSGEGSQGACSERPHTRPPFSPSVALCSAITSALGSGDALLGRHGRQTNRGFVPQTPHTVTSYVRLASLRLGTFARAIGGSYSLILPFWPCLLGLAAVLRDVLSFIAASLSDAPVALCCHYPQSLISPPAPSSDRDTSTPARAPALPPRVAYLCILAAMVADDLYEKALPVLQNDALDEEDKTDQLEELMRKETNLVGKSLENIVLDCLWRYRDAGSSSSSPPPSRHTVIRRPSPAPWQQRASTPVNNSPRTVHPPPGFGIAPPAFNRAKSSTASPFTSPRPSPRLAFSSPHIPHSPSLSAYQFSEGVSPNSDLYGDLDSHSVDWLVNDEFGSTESSLLGDGTLNGGAAEWVQPQTMDMGPYDMLRSILRDDRSDEELEKVLEANGFDLSAALLALMGQQMDGQPLAPTSHDNSHYLIGKSMTPTFRSATPVGQQKSNIVCKYFLSTGHCARADCRFSHDTSKTLCK
jgi:hypothetical protein